MKNQMIKKKQGYSLTNSVRKVFLFALILFSLFHPQSGKAQVPSYVPLGGLLAWYNFNNNPVNSAPPPNNGVPYGDVAYGTDRFGNPASCYVGDGNSGIDIPTNNFPTGNATRTVSSWYKTPLPQPSGNMEIFATGNNSAAGNRFGLFADIPSPGIGFESAGVGVVRALPADSAWHHLVITYPPSGAGTASIKVYFDGVLSSSSICCGSISVLNTAASPIHCIGALFTYGPPSYQYSWIGSLDDIGVWDTALTACQVWHLYSADTSTYRTIIGDSVVCVGDSISLGDTLSGGTWSSNTTSVATIGEYTGIVTGLSAGATIITYTLPDSLGGCYFTKIITVKNCPHPCTNSTNLTVTDSSGQGGCTFNATATVSTSNMIVGYQWSGVGGAVIHNNHTGTDHYSFSLSPGSTDVVTCVVYIVDTNFTDSAGPCCQAVLTQTVTCPADSTKTGCCFDSSNTYLTDTNSSFGGNCVFKITAHYQLLKGCTFIGYIWSDPSYNSGIVSWSSFTYPTMPPSTDGEVNVTFISIQPNGDTCEVTRSLVLVCPPKPPSGEEAPADGISIFPNPTTNEVTITSITENLDNIEVIDVNGKKVGNYSYKNTKTATISLEKLPAGTYLFRVNNTESKVVTKVN